VAGNKKLPLISPPDAALYDVQGGAEALRIDGVDIKEMNLDENARWPFRASVLQESILFSGRVGRAIIRLGNCNAFKTQNRWKAGRREGRQKLRDFIEPLQGWISRRKWCGGGGLGRLPPDKKQGLDFRSQNGRGT